MLGVAVLLAAWRSHWPPGGGAGQGLAHRQHGRACSTCRQNSDVLVDETVTFAFSGTFSYVGRSIPTGNLDGLTDIR